jgi:hypothetical protein
LCFRFRIIGARLTNWKVCNLSKSHKVWFPDVKFFGFSILKFLAETESEVSKKGSPFFVVLVDKSLSAQGPCSDHPFSSRYQFVIHGNLKEEEMSH